MCIHETGGLWMSVQDSNQKLESGCVLQKKFDMPSSLAHKIYVRQKVGAFLASSELNLERWTHKGVPN
jgi:hypothetical protein